MGQKICDVSIRTADNGVIINYTLKTKRSGSGPYDDYSHDYKTEVFDCDEEEDLMEALERFKSLFIQSMKDNSSKMMMPSLHEKSEE
jgi:hypothetical protein